MNRENIRAGTSRSVLLMFHLKGCDTNLLQHPLQHCIYIAGSSVYQPRRGWYTYEPAMYQRHVSEASSTYGRRDASQRGPQGPTATRFNPHNSWGSPESISGRLSSDPGPGQKPPMTRGPARVNAAHTVPVLSARNIPSCMWFRRRQKPSPKRLASTWKWELSSEGSFPFIMPVSHRWVGGGGGDLVS